MVACQPDGSERAEGSASGALTVPHIQSLTISNPRKALALLDTAESADVVSPYEIAALRGLAFHNGLSDYNNALHYNLEAYRQPEASSNATDFLRLIDLIADEYLANGNYDASMRFCAEGLKVAKDSLMNDAEANLHITMGMNLMEMERADDAFVHFKRALQMLGGKFDASSGYEHADDYIYAIGVTMNAMCDDGRYDDALTLMPEYDRALEVLKTSTDVPDGLVDMRIASVEAMKAYIYGKKGEYDEADKSIERYRATEYSRTPEGEAMRIPYLISARRFKEALYYLSREKDFWQANADTDSYSYIDAHLRIEQQAYEGLGDWRSANAVLNAIDNVTDTLRRRERDGKALELAEIYKTNEQALRIEHQNSSIRMRNVIIAFGLIVLIGAVVFICRMVRYNRLINRKNEAMVKTIDELSESKHRLYLRQAENIRLRDRLHDACDGTDGKGDEKESSSQSLGERDRELWDRMSHGILSEQLYLRTDLTKRELTARFHVPVNKFPLLFKEFAGCSFPQFIQDCRLDHAVKLMRQNPQWSFEAVAKESQMSKSAFYDRFYKKYGMRPSEFRDREEAMGNA